MTTYCFHLLRWSVWVLFGLVGATVSAQMDTYYVTDVIFDETGIKPDLHLHYEAGSIATAPHSVPTGQWYLLDFIKLQPEEAATYRNYQRVWDRDHALCSVHPTTGGWHLFRVTERRGLAGAYDFVTATPLPGEWHEWSQAEYLPTELFTHVPPALERLLAQSTGYRELRWIRPCVPGTGCHILAANR